MYAAPGTGLAANQVGVQRRIFVYDVGEGHGPSSTRASSRVTASGPTKRLPLGARARWEIVRPNAVHLVGVDLDGNEVSIEATELEGRCSNKSSIIWRASCWWSG